jgi:hypothetical protein
MKNEKMKKMDKKEKPRFEQGMVKAGMQQNLSGKK